MKLTDYCIRHPIVAWVGNLLILLVGWLCLDHMVMREYPVVTFNKFIVHAHYPNASAELVETAVTSVLEEQLAGLDGLNTIVSDIRDGGCSIRLAFRPGTDLNRSWMNIREAVGRARDQLPPTVREPTVNREGSSNDGPSFMFMTLQSNTMQPAELTHFAHVQIKNVLSSVPGVVRLEVMGKPYNFQISLRPHDMYTFGMNVDTVYETLQKAHVSLPVGKFQGRVPATLESQLHTVEDYENLVLKVNTDEASNNHTPVLLKHIAGIKLDGQEKSIMRVNGQDSVGLFVRKADDANPLDVSRDLQQVVATLQQQLPAGTTLKIITDQADYVRHSMNQMQSALLEAMLCVGLVIWLFLRNLKAVVIPLVTIPMSLFGAVIFLSMLGMSINLMTLMAMVLAVGLVVDDAIVVLENIQRHQAKGLSPLDAALKGSSEIAFAIVAMTGTLMSVYIPLAFIHGTVGYLFGEFAVALAGSVIISGVVALTLSPYMCAHISRHYEESAWLIRLRNLYKKTLAVMLNSPTASILIWVLCVVCMLMCLRSLPYEVAPSEDRGVVGAYVEIFPGQKLTDVHETLGKLEKSLKLPEEADLLEMASLDWGGNLIYCLKPCHKRRLSADECVNVLRKQVRDVPSVDAYPWSWSNALPGVEDGTRNTQIELVLSTTGSYADMFRDVKQAIQALQNNEDIPLFEDLSQNVNNDTMAYRIDVDKHLISLLGLSPQMVARTIEVFFDEDDSLHFSKDGILYNLTLRGMTSPETLSSLYITNNKGARISVAEVAQMRLTVEPSNLYRYGGMRSVKLTTQLPKDMSMQQAMEKLDQGLSQQLKGTYAKTWESAAKMNLKSHATLMGLLGLSLVFILALLVLQFHNVVDPIITVLTVPFAAFGALGFLWLMGGSLNIYTQIGLITLVGLVTKHGILIVEFVNQRLKDGTPLMDAVIQAADQRFRPILMTTMAMLLGALPLAWSYYPGYEARRAMGFTLLSGLTCGTILTLLVLPVLCWMVKRKTSSLKVRL